MVCKTTFNFFWIWASCHIHLFTTKEANSSACLQWAGPGCSTDILSGTQLQDLVHQSCEIPQKSRYNIRAYQGKTKRTGVESSSTQVEHGTPKNYLDIFHIDFILTLTSSHDLHVSFFHLAYHDFNDWSAASHFRSNLSSGHKSQPYQRSVGCFLHAESLISLKINWLKKRLAMKHKLNITIYDEWNCSTRLFF